MTKTKKSLGMNWTRYHNLYSVTYKLHEDMKSLGWLAEVIQKYTVNHAHEVNEENATKTGITLQTCPRMMIPNGCTGTPSYQAVARPLESSCNQSQ